ncbi:hypothetical protein ACHAXT_008872 [Thalassiosira profunda]
MSNAEAPAPLSLEGLNLKIAALKENEQPGIQPSSSWLQPISPEFIPINYDSVAGDIHSAVASSNDPYEILDFLVDNPSLTLLTISSGEKGEALALHHFKAFERGGEKVYHALLGHGDSAIAVQVLPSRLFNTNTIMVPTLDSILATSDPASEAIAEEVEEKQISNSVILSPSLAKTILETNPNLSISAIKQLVLEVSHELDSNAKMRWQQQQANLEEGVQLGSWDNQPIRDNLSVIQSVRAWDASNKRDAAFKLNFEPQVQSWQKEANANLLRNQRATLTPDRPTDNPAHSLVIPRRKTPPPPGTSSTPTKPPLPPPRLCPSPASNGPLLESTLLKVASCMEQMTNNQTAQLAEKNSTSKHVIEMLKNASTIDGQEQAPQLTQPMKDFLKAPAHTRGVNKGLFVHPFGNPDNVCITNLPPPGANSNQELDRSRLKEEEANGRELSEKEREALYGSKLLPARTIYHLKEKTKAWAAFANEAHGPDSIAANVAADWDEWVQNNIQLLKERSIAIDKDLAARIEHIIDDSFNQYYEEAMHGVPDESILESDTIRRGILRGTVKPDLPKIVFDVLHPQPKRDRTDRDRGSAGGGGGGPTKKARFEIVHHDNQGRTCNSNCPRAVAHKSPQGNAARMDKLRKARKDATEWYKNNKKPSDPNFDLSPSHHTHTHPEETQTIPHHHIIFSTITADEETTNRPEGHVVIPRAIRREDNRRRRRRGVRRRDHIDLPIARAGAQSKSDFRYDFSLEAAEHNSAILAAHNYDLAAAISSQGFTELTMGSEIRPIAQLDRLLRHHPHYEEARKLLLEGVDYPAADLPEETRRARLESQLRKGNQASALTQEALPIITKLMIDDIVKGYALIVTIDCIKRLKDAEVYPMGLQHQLTVNEKGETIPKKRLTQNLSADRKSGLSINQRISLEDLPPTKYGWALLRYVHLIHHIRYRNPGRRILCNKIDIDKAYRRIHTTPTVSAKCCATWKLHEINDATGEISKESDVDIATIMNRLPFGSRPAPAYFSQISEITFDLANDLIRCQLWDPSTTPPPLQHELPARNAYQTTRPSASLSKPTWNSRRMWMEAARATSTTAQPPYSIRPKTPKWPHEASIRKLLAEGGLKELIIFLGWLINTRAFTIALPKEKASAWIRSIVEVINKPSAQWQELATLVGRLNHACYVIPSARHFINRIRRAQELADKYRSIRIDDETKRDLLLWIDLLRKASGGISINNIVYRKPTCIPITDASEIGIGGYCLNSNKLWRYQFNTYEQRSFTLNAKEYIASVVGAIIALEDDSSSHPCVASLSDSTSTVAWLHKSNHDPNSHPIHNAIARWHARESSRGKRLRLLPARPWTIVASDRPDPRLTQSGSKYLMITRQIRSYTKVDAPPKHQKALPPEVYRQTLRNATQPREQARAQQLGASVFFCMRSCEYSKTPRKEQKTRTLRPCDITFRVGGREIPHDHPDLHLALTVIQRLRSYPNYNDEWRCTPTDGKRFSNISSSEYLADIRIAVDIIGKDVLGFTSAEVGTHSNRSGGAMMMYLAKTPPYTIMMQGRWHSNAFLRYIEKQVLEFSQGVARKMLLRNTFFNVPLRPSTAPLEPASEAE